MSYPSLPSKRQRANTAGDHYLTQVASRHLSPLVSWQDRIERYKHILFRNEYEYAAYSRMTQEFEDRGEIFTSSEMGAYHYDRDGSVSPDQPENEPPREVSEVRN